MTFRFVHTADLHLDSPLVSLALRDPGLAEEVATASREVLTRIVDLCLTEQVHALLIAGDLWDGAQTSAKTPRFLQQALGRLDEAGIRCFIIRGNHDAAAKVTTELHPPPLTRVFKTQAGTEVFEAGGQLVAVHGLSFAEGAVPESLLPRYPPARPGAFNIGMMHTSLDGSPSHDRYAPCALADLDAHGYDYWALGHIHKRAEYRGRAAVLMPGIPQGRDIGEAGPCTVTLGAFDGTDLRLETRSVASLRFERVTVDLGGVADWAAGLQVLRAALAGARRAVPDDLPLVLRLVLTGATGLAFLLARDLDLLTQEATSAAESLPRLWLDKIENRTTGDLTPPLPADLLALVSAPDPATAAMLQRLAAEFVADLPAELRDLLGQDEAAQQAATTDLLAEGMATLIPRLAAGEA